jgi:hypothetical protein
MRIVPKINRRKSLLKLNQLLRSENLLLRKQLEVAAEQLQKKDQLVVPVAFDSKGKRKFISVGGPDNSERLVQVVPVEFMPEQFRKGVV